MKTISILSFIEDDHPISLITPEEIEQAIADGRITAATPVTLYFSDRTNIHKAAGQHPELSAIAGFGNPNELNGNDGRDGGAPDTTADADDDPVAAPAAGPVASRSAPPRATATPDAMPEAGDPPPSTWLPTSALPEAGPPGAETPTSAQPGKAKGCLLLFLALVAILLLIGQCSSSERAAYAVTGIDVHAQPDASAEVVARLSAGAAVVVAKTESEAWWKIVRGAGAGGFVPANRLSDEAPPPLDTAAAGDRKALTGPVPFYDSPGATTSSGAVAAGERYSILGRVAGDGARDGAGWYQIVRPEGHGGSYVAYVRAEEAGRVKQVDMPAPVAPTAEPVDSIAEDVPDDILGCGQESDDFARLSCKNPDLRILDQRLARSWKAANDRFMAADARIDPYSRFREPIVSCRSAPCVRKAYGRQIAALDALMPPAPRSVVYEPPPRSFARDPQPAERAERWIRGDDYPARALREERGGTVGVRLRIDTKGSVADCIVIRSSGHADLDQETCRAMRRRGRFRPALDDRGNIVEGFYTPPQVIWRIP